MHFISDVPVVDPFHIKPAYFAYKYCVSPLQEIEDILFSSPVRKYKKNYYSHPGVGVALMLKILVTVFISLYLLKMWMDYVDTLHVGRYWSKVLFCTIMTHAIDHEVKVTDLEILC